ncbi:MAG: hypothetical protein ACI4MN_05975 [Candidatus Coproplasma sp.]
MKRSELKALLGTLENKDEVIDHIMEINGTDIENAKRSVNTSGLTAQLEERDNKILEQDAIIKSYQKGGDKYIDGTEFERLKKFETDTLAAAKKERQVAAVKKLLKNENAREDMLELLINGVDIDSITVQDDGSVKDGAKLVAGLKEKYAASFDATSHTGGAPFSATGGKSVGDGADNGFNFNFTPVNNTPKKT